MRHFGLGFVAAVPVGVANPTPVPFALVKGLSYDYTKKLVKERGQWKHVVAVGEGDNDVTGKLDNIEIMSGAIAQLTGGAVTAGSKIGVPGETFTLAAAAYTAVNGATYAADYGVYDNTTGLALTCVAAAPASGQYTINTGTGAYAFNAADNGHKMAATYSYTAAAAGKTTSIVNTPTGIATGYVLVGYGPSVNGKCLGVKFYNAFIPKLSLALAPDAFTKQSLEFFACQDTGSTAVLDIYTGE